MKLKYMIIGFIAGIFAATALTAGASTIYEKYTAVARPDYKLVVDGQQVTLNTPPKTIDGVTHLPIRDAATILGKDVEFKSGTITLTTKSKGGENMTETNDTINVEDWISIQELRDQYPNIIMTLGQDELSENTLTIQAGEVTLKVLNLVQPKDADRATYLMSNGNQIDIIYIKGSTYLPKVKLQELSIIQ